ncbi:MAG: hypothetical protein WCC87_24300 [Candidatus Korobacteraceae bacterium]
MKTSARFTRLLSILAVGAVCLTFTLSMNAQVQTETKTTVGKPTHEVQVDRAEVIAVSGDDLVLKMEDGSTRDVSVPANAKVTVDGNQIGIRDVKPGMKLQRTVVTTTTPKVITTVQTVTGKVWYVKAPSVLILTLEDGTNQQFKIPKDQMFLVKLSPGDPGKMVDAFALKKGMQISATKVTEEPVNSISVKKQLTGTFPPDSPVLVATATSPGMGAGAGSGAEGSAGATSAGSLPKTASFLPLIGLLGALSLAASFGLKAFRRIA